MGDPAPAESAERTTRTTFLTSCIPPYMLSLGSRRGICAAMVSLSGFLCEIIFMPFVILMFIQFCLRSLLYELGLPEPLFTPLAAVDRKLATLLRESDVLSDVFGVVALVSIGAGVWWGVSGSLLCFMLGGRDQLRDLYHENRSWCAYIFGGGWASFPSSD